MERRHLHETILLACIWVLSEVFAFMQEYRKGLRCFYCKIQFSIYRFSHCEQTWIWWFANVRERLRIQNVVRCDQKTIQKTVWKVFPVTNQRSSPHWGAYESTSRNRSVLSRKKAVARMLICLSSGRNSSAIMAKPSNQMYFKSYYKSNFCSLKTKVYTGNAKRSWTSKLLEKQLRIPYKIDPYHFVELKLGFPLMAVSVGKTHYVPHPKRHLQRHS